MEHTDATKTLSIAERIRPVTKLLAGILEKIGEALGGPMLFVMYVCTVQHHLYCEVLLRIKTFLSLMSVICLSADLSSWSAIPLVLTCISYSGCISALLSCFVCLQCSIRYLLHSSHYYCTSPLTF